MHIYLFYHIASKNTGKLRLYYVLLLPCVFYSVKCVSGAAKTHQNAFDIPGPRQKLAREVEL